MTCGERTVAQTMPNIKKENDEWRRERKDDSEEDFEDEVQNPGHVNQVEKWWEKKTQKVH